MSGVFQNIGESLKYGFSVSSSHIPRWIGLTIVLIIPILNFLGIGVLLKVFRGQDPNFEHGGRCFLQGFLTFIIGLIYLIIPFVAFLLIVPFGIFGLIAAIIIFLIFVGISTPALINYARMETFGAAFDFSKIFSMIRSITVGRFIGTLIIYLIVSFIIGFIIQIFTIIPLIGTVVSLVLSIVVTVPLALYSAKFWHNTFPY